MRCSSSIFICFLLINLSSSLTMMNRRHLDRQRGDEINQSSFARASLTPPSVDSESSSANICSAEPINIDALSSESESNPDIHPNTSTTANTIDISEFVSSWQRERLQHDLSTATNIVQITFTVPYKLSTDSILNKTVYITDAAHSHLLASLTDICIHASSFIINYASIKPLPHNICLYLLLNLTSSAILRDIVFCRTIDYPSNRTSSSDESTTEASHAVGPSGFFIVSQCVIILIMMAVIYGVQTARQKSLINRVGQRLMRSRPYMIAFGNNAEVSAVDSTPNASTNAATTLQVGLNDLMINRHLTALASFKVPAPIEEQVLAANDLTSTINDRRATRPYLNRDLIDVKEFTKRMSASNESTTENELHILNNKL